jgi:GNAT superfamily N-acetyltransferase
MTRDTREITPGMQAAWWRPEHELWLFDGVGYALLSEREVKTWISLGLLPEARGRGLGTRIYRHFTGVWAEIRSDNIASRRAAEKAGYVLSSDDGERAVMHG